MRNALSGLAAFARRRTLALWLVCMAVAAVIALRSTYVADLSAFLPSTPSAEQAVLLDQLRTGVASRLVLIGIEGGTPAQRITASRQLAHALRQSGAFEAVHNGDNAQFEATGQFLFEHRYLLSPAVDAQRFSVDGLRAGILDATALLGTPAGAFIKPLILRDPTGETVRMAEAMLPAQAPRSDGGVWVSRSAARAVLLATTRADGANLDAQERTLQLVRSSFAPFEAQGLTLVVSGSGTFAVASRTQIKSEVERLAIAGGVAIVALLLLAFGSLRTLGLALLPVASGVLAGIAAVSVVFGNVHGITLGFGTTLIGEAVDYAIYYLIQAHALPALSVGSATSTGAQRWIAGNWPTVRLGLWTSICGFAALLFSGFPGLAQLGLFSIAGLTAAALTTRCVFPALAPNGAPGVGLRHRLGRTVGWLTATLPRLRWPLAALALLAAVALVLLPSPWRGDLGSLSPVGTERMKIDAGLRADLGASDAGTLIAVSAADEAGVLAQAERAGARLDRLVDARVLAGYESPARILPSPALQAARRSALPDAATLSANLAQATVDGPLPAQRLSGFVDDVQAARQQPLLTRAALQGTPLGSALDAQLVPGSGTRPWRALLSLQAGAQGVDVAKLRAALADVPGAQVVNIIGELDALYARYLHEATLQALLGALAVCGLLALHLRSLARLWRIAQPIVAAVLIVLAALTASGAALGILHLVGLLLTVAIGSNYALFFDQIREQQASRPASGGPAVDTDTLASLALANLTAVISFCLLAFSSIPALFAIGQVVAPGILLSLLLSAAFIPARAGVNPITTGGALWENSAPPPAGHRMHASTSHASPVVVPPQWRWPMLLKASAACHLGAGALVIAQPALWPWALGAVALDHALVTATGLWPRSTWLGDNLRRLPGVSAARGEVSLTIDDGPNPAVTPAVLDLLDAAGARATFFCIARAAEAHPQLCREIVRRGHSVQNHSHSHLHSFSLLGPRGFAREIGQAQDSLSQITGQRPRFFRAPAGLRNPFLAAVLQAQGLQLVSWTRRGFDTLRTAPAGVLARLTRGLAAGDILLLHDGNVALAPSGNPVVLEVLPELLRRFDQAGLRAVSLVDAVPATPAEVPA